MRFFWAVNAYLKSFSRQYQQRNFRKWVEAERRKTNLFERKQSLGFFAYAQKMLKQKKRFGHIISAAEKHIGDMQLAFVSLGLFLILGTIYVVVFSSYFQIAPSKVIIERLDSHSDINLAYRSIDSVYGNSIFLTTPKEVSAKVVSWQKSIADAQVTRLYPNGLKIILKSYPIKFFTEFALDGKKKTYLISQNGVLIEDRTIEKGVSRLDIQDSRLEESILLNYKEAIPADTMTQILALKEGFQKKFTNISIAKLVFFRAEKELHMHLENGMIILFDLQSLLPNQLSLVRLYTDSHPETLQKDLFTYIDVRNQGKIFLCQDKKICRANLSRIYGAYYY